MATLDGLDLYGLLGVASNATDEEIKRAYRQKARQLHPDANGGDASAEARFKEVSLAYEVLRDPERRARYDRFGPEGVFGQGAGGMNFDFEAGLSDIFEAFFGSMSTRGTRRGPMTGADAEIGLRLSFTEAAFGAEKELSVRLPVSCQVCDGSGAAPGTQAITCPDCQGAGEIRRIRQSLLGQVVTAVACGRCQGTGELTPNPCEACGG
ncbi:MAG: DnaJ domain-containing protein, partial [Acidimicrobiales bacterium]